MSEPLLVYYSSDSQNTHRFVGKLGFSSLRIPVSPKDKAPVVDREFVLVCPTYAGDKGQGAVPKQVIHFLNNEKNRFFLKGLIASGNKNFGEYFGHAGVVISKKCNVPLLYRFELMGTEEDVLNVRTGLTKFWQTITNDASLAMAS